MLKYLFRRFLALIPTVFIITVIIFGIVKSMPGDQARLSINPLELERLNPAEVDALIEAKRIELGLDKSLPEQYLIWIKNIASGDLGYSMKHNKPVLEYVTPFIKNSVILNFYVIIVSFLIAIPIGIISAVKKYSIFDNFWQVFSLVGISLPSFFFAMILIFAFAIRLDIFPISGMSSNAILFDDEKLTGMAYYLDLWKHMFLPSTVLIIGSLAGTIRYVRNAMLDVLRQDYIRTARSKGLSEKVVIYSHAFRNALIPVVTLVAFTIPVLFGGSTITETMFQWPGIGKELLASLHNRDLAVVLTMNLFYATLALLANIIMDIGYALVDPRVKLN